MKPVVTGIIAAVAVILAFLAGSQIEIHDTDGPVEEVAEETADAVEHVTDAAEGAANDAADRAAE